MINHPNRGKPRAGSRPTREDVAKAREASRLTQKQAAELVYRTERAWQMWEAGDRAMPADTYELFLIKTGQRKP